MTETDTKINSNSKLWVVKCNSHLNMIEGNMYSGLSTVKDNKNNSNANKNILVTCQKEKASIYIYTQMYIWQG